MDMICGIENKSLSYRIMLAKLKINIIFHNFNHDMKTKHFYDLYGVSFYLCLVDMTFVQVCDAWLIFLIYLTNYQYCE